MKVIKGNIFNSEAKALVNTVNCVGVMGKGIALEFRRRYPDMFIEYKRVCENGELKPGQIWQYKGDNITILNFAIKNDWKHPSKIEWIEKCLIEFSENYSEWGVKSVAFPWMGAVNGGLPFSQIKEKMTYHLKKIKDIKIEIYDFDPNVGDPLFDKLIEITDLEHLDFNKLVMASDIQKRYLEKLIERIRQGDIRSLTKLEELKVFGSTNIEKLYAFLIDPNNVPNKFQKATWF